MDGVYMYNYAVDEKGNILKKLQDGDSYPGTIFRSEQDLGDGDIIETGGYRCYKFCIENDLPVERQIKRYGIKDDNNDIIISCYYHKKPVNGYELNDNVIVLDPTYNVPRLYVDGSIVKIK